MKSKIFKLLILILVGTLTLTLVSCKPQRPGNRPGEEFPEGPEVPVNKYTVTFDSNGGTEIESIEVTENGLVAKPTSPTKTGYSFVDWYKEETLENIWAFSNDKVTANMTLYAKWQQESTDADWKLVDNSKLNSILKNKNLNVFNNKHYNLMGSLTGTMMEDSQASFEGIIDLESNFMNQESNIRVSTVNSSQSPFNLYQQNGVFYQIYDDESYENYGTKYGDNEDLDLFKLVFYQNRHQLNDTFKSMISYLMANSFETDISSKDLLVYQDGNAHKIELDLTNSIYYEELIKFLTYFFGFNDSAELQEDFYSSGLKLKLIFDKKDITDLALDINFSTSDGNFFGSIILGVTDTKADIPENLDSLTKVDTYSTNLKFIYSTDKEKNYNTMSNSTYFRYERLVQYAYLDGYDIEGIYFDENYTKPVGDEFYSSAEEIVLYIKVSESIFSNDYLDQIAKVKNYTINFDNGKTILVTKDYVFSDYYGMHLYSKGLDKLLSNNDGTILDITGSTYMDLLYMNLAEMLEQTPLVFYDEYTKYHLYASIKDSNTYLLYDFNARTFRFGFNEFDGYGEYKTELEFSITNIKTTEISPEIMDNFNGNEEIDDEVIEIDLVTNKIPIVTKENEDYLEVTGYIIFNEKVVRINNINELANYGITYKFGKVDESDILGIFKDFILYEFFQDERLIASYPAVIHDQSRGKILVNPLFDGQPLEPVIYYVNELDDFEEIGYTEEYTITRFTYQGQRITSLEQLKAITDEVIHLDEETVYNTANTFYNKITNEIFNLNFNGKYYSVDLETKSILNSRLNLKLVSYDGVYYFDKENDYEGVLFENTPENRKHQLREHEIVELNKMIDLLSILLDSNNYSLSAKTVVIKGLDTFDYENANDNTLTNNKNGNRIYFTSYADQYRYYDVEIVHFGKYLLSSRHEGEVYWLLSRLIDKVPVDKFYLDETLEEILEVYSYGGPIKGLKLYFNVNDVVEDNTFMLLNELFELDSYVLEGESTYIVTKDVIKYITSDDNGKKVYVLDRKTQTTYESINDILYATTFKVMDLEYVINNVEYYNFSISKDFDYENNISSIKVIYTFRDRNQSIEVSLSDLNEIELKEDFNNYGLNKYSITKKNNIPLPPFNFNDIKTDKVISVEIEINNNDYYFNFQRIIDALIITMHYENKESEVYSGYKDNFLNKYEYSLIKNENLATFTIKIDNDTYTLDKIKFLNYGDKGAIFFTNNTKVLLFEEEIMNLNSIDELNDLLGFDDLLFKIDFAGWIIDYYDSVYSIETIKELVQNSNEVVEFRQNYSDNSFRHLLYRANEGIYFSYKDFGIEKNGEMLTLNDQNWDYYNGTIDSEGNIILYYNDELVDLSDFDSDVLELIQFIHIGIYKYNSFNDGVIGFEDSSVTIVREEERGFILNFKDEQIYLR